MNPTRRLWEFPPRSSGRPQRCEGGGTGGEKFRDNESRAILTMVTRAIPCLRYLPLTVEAQHGRIDA
jgi:hypothetical protein